MKNANSRFVRVLAIALVVLMVVPAALVGCGSNKANNAAISEALAAAEAARKEAEEAKAAADAAAAEAAAKAAAEAQKALEEANKKAEEAIKAAEEAKKKAEEAEKQAAEAAKTTAAPTTTAPVVTEDMKVVSDYAYQMLSDSKLDFLKAYFTYAYGMEEEAIVKMTAADVKSKLAKEAKNPVYTAADREDMVALYDATVVAIYQANTVDYINALVANFVKALSSTKTYIEHVVAAYEAIDFASNYDVVDVVYAYGLIVKADADLKANDYYKDFKDALTKYGENKIDVLEAIATEYYRYTGVDTAIFADKTAIEDDDILYEDMYEAALEIAAKVYDLIPDAVKEKDDDDLYILDATMLPYDAKIDSLVAAVVKEYTKWNTKYFVNADDTNLVGYYEDFRKAFVGEDYILQDKGDYVWDALVAFEARATELLTAAAEYETGFKSELNSIARPTDIKYWNYIEKVASVGAALDAWKVKYNFLDDEDGKLDPNVKNIIEKYDDYAENAAIVNYFVYLENTASALNIDAFMKAYEEDLLDNGTVMFTYSKYGSAVGAVIDWFFGKEKNETRVDGFIEIAPDAEDEFFEELADIKVQVEGADTPDDADDDVYVPYYTVAYLIYDDNQNIVKLFDRVFGLKDVDAFVDMLTVYEALRDAKEDAAELNDDIEELLEKGVSVKASEDLVAILGADYAEIFDPDIDEEDKYTNLAGKIKNEWMNDNTCITAGDANFLEMIDWEAIDTMYANYKASTKLIEESAVEVALQYIAWKGTYDAENETITYKDKTLGDITFEDLDPIEINIYSYAFVEKVLELYSALDVKNAAAIKIKVPQNSEDDYEITLKDVANFCVEIRTHFYSIVDTLQLAMYNVIYNDYPILSAKAESAENPWRSDYHYSQTLADRQAYYDNYVNAGNRIDISVDPNNIIKPAVLEVLKDNNFTRRSTRQYGNLNQTPAGSEFKHVSYEFAVYSVNPLDYATKSAEGKVLSFDAAGYKAALNASIDKMYNSYMASYLKSGTVAAPITAPIAQNIALNTLNTGLWVIEGEIVIADETFAYEINTDKNGTAWKIKILDADTEVVTHVDADTVKVAFELKDEDYEVTLEAVLANGVLKIFPALTTKPVDSNKTVYDVVGGIKAEDFEDEAPYFAYDVRDYVDQIAANGEKVTNIVLLGGKKATLDTFTAAQFNALYAAEAKNVFNVNFSNYQALIYNSNTTYAAWLLGTYVTNVKNMSVADAKTALTTKTADKTDAVVAELVKISQAAYQDAYGMTSDMNTVEEIKAVFEAFALEVQHKLDDLGVAYTVNGAANTLTITGLVTE